MPEWAILVAILITLLAMVIGGGIWVVWAFVRRTAGVSGPNIGFGLSMAFATALLVFILVYLSAWAEMRQFIAMGDIGSSQPTSMRNDFVLIRRELSDYFHLHDHYPDSLDHVPSLKGNRFLDAWGHEYQYSKTANGYSLLSLGRDGKPGGIGLDASGETGAVRPVVPGTATKDTDISGVWASGVVPGGFGVVFRTVPVRAPLPRISMDVKQSPAASTYYEISKSGVLSYA